MLKKLLFTIGLSVCVSTAWAKTYTTLELLNSVKKQEKASELLISGTTLYESDPLFQKAVQRVLKPVGLDLDDFDMGIITTPQDFTAKSYTTHFWQKRLHSAGQYEQSELALFLSYAPKTQKIVIVVFNADGEIGDTIFQVLGDKKETDLVNNIVQHPYFDVDLRSRVLNQK